jgi:threonine dehydrogenase-like Zn-dependent dehydrogenase
MKALYFENDPLRFALYRAARLVQTFPQLGALSPVRYAEVPEPKLPNSRWLMVRNIACGLCGTDIHFMGMDISPKSYSAALPGIKRKYLGHESVGEVIETGSEAAGFAVGDRVAFRMDWPCCAQMDTDPPCRQCAAGSPMLCENVGLGTLPDAVGGGFSPRMAVHPSQLFKIPAALGNDAAVLLEPTACAAHGVLKARAHLVPGARVLIIGGGTIGLVAAAACRVLVPGIEVYASVRYPSQAKVAEALGARVISGKTNLYAETAKLTGGRHIKGMFGNEIVLGGFDVVLDTVGGEESFQQALRLARPGGRVVLLGINFSPGRLDYSPIWAREVEVTGINCHGIEHDGRNTFETAAEVLERTPELPGLIITHRFAMDDYRHALQAFMNKRESGAIKIVLEHGK